MSPKKQKKAKKQHNKKIKQRTMSALCMCNDEYKAALALGNKLSSFADLVQESDKTQPLEEIEEAAYIATVLTIFAIYGRRSKNPMKRVLDTLAECLNDLAQ